MKIIKPNAILIDDSNVSEFEKIEMVGRTCYKSNDKITEGSAVKFVQSLEKSKHYAMLEHAYIYMIIDTDFAIRFRNTIDLCNTFITNNSINNGKELNEIGKHLNITIADINSAISGSFRTFLEILSAFDKYNLIAYNSPIDKIAYMLNYTYPELFDYDIKLSFLEKCFAKSKIIILNKDTFIEAIKDEIAIKAMEDAIKFNKYHENTIKELGDAIISKHVIHTILFTTDRGVSHEFVRHRPASFAQESTRYCNYSKDKFGNEITVIEPLFDPESEKYKIWKESCENDEKNYFRLLELGCTAQEARGNLPTDVKTDIIITATEIEWQHIINLRYYGKTGAPHPKMKQVMNIAYPLLIEASDNRLN